MIYYQDGILNVPKNEHLRRDFLIRNPNIVYFIISQTIYNRFDIFCSIGDTFVYSWESIVKLLYLSIKYIQFIMPVMNSSVSSWKNLSTVHPLRY